MSSNEIWEDIAGFVGHYQISNFGRYKSVKNFKNGSKRDKVLKTHKKYYDQYSYAKLDLCDITTYLPIHRVVGEAFIPKVTGKDIINHKNGVRSDNRVENLEWCDKRENMVHAMNTLGVLRNGSYNPNSKYTDEQINELIKLRNSGKSVYACIKELSHFKRTTAYSILNKKIRKTHTYAI